MEVAEVANRVQESKANGYSDAEIVSLLAQRPEFAEKIRLSRENGYDDSAIVAHLSGVNPAARVQAIADEHGAVITSSLRPGAVTNAGTPSPHRHTGVYDLQIPGADIQAHQQLADTLRSQGYYVLLEEPGSAWAARGNRGTVVHADTTRGGGVKGTAVAAPVPPQTTAPAAAPAPTASRTAPTIGPQGPLTAEEQGKLADLQAASARYGPEAGAPAGPHTYGGFSRDYVERIIRPAYQADRAGAFATLMAAHPTWSRASLNTALGEIGLEEKRRPQFYTVPLSEAAGNEPAPTSRTEPGVTPAKAWETTELGGRVVGHEVASTAKETAMGLGEIARGITSPEVRQHFGEDIGTGMEAAAVGVARAGANLATFGTWRPDIPANIPPGAVAMAEVGVTPLTFAVGGVAEAKVAGAALRAGGRVLPRAAEAAAQASGAYRNLQAAAKTGQLSRPAAAALRASQMAGYMIGAPGLVPSAMVGGVAKDVNPQIQQAFASYRDSVDRMVDPREHPDLYRLLRDTPEALITTPAGMLAFRGSLVKNPAATVMGFAKPFLMPVQSWHEDPAGTLMMWLLVPGLESVKAIGAVRAQYGGAGLQEAERAIRDGDPEAAQRALRSVPQFSDLPPEQQQAATQAVVERLQATGGSVFAGPAAREAPARRSPAVREAMATAAAAAQAAPERAVVAPQEVPAGVSTAAEGIARPPEATGGIDGAGNGGGEAGGGVEQAVGGEGPAGSAAGPAVPAERGMTLAERERALQGTDQRPLYYRPVEPGKPISLFRGMATAADETGMAYREATPGVDFYTQSPSKAEHYSQRLLDQGLMERTEGQQIRYQEGAAPHVVEVSYTPHQVLDLTGNAPVEAWAIEAVREASPSSAELLAKGDREGVADSRSRRDPAEPEAIRGGAPARIRHGSLSRLYGRWHRSKRGAAGTRGTSGAVEYGLPAAGGAEGSGGGSACQRRAGTGTEGPGGDDARGESAAVAPGAGREGAGGRPGGGPCAAGVRGVAGDVSRVGGRVSGVREAGGDGRAGATSCPTGHGGGGGHHWGWSPRPGGAGEAGLGERPSVRG